MTQGGDALRVRLWSTCREVLARASGPSARARACSALTAAFLLFLAAHPEARAVAAQPLTAASATVVAREHDGSAVVAPSPAAALGPCSHPGNCRGESAPLLRFRTVRGFGLPSPRAPDC